MKTFQSLLIFVLSVLISQAQVGATRQPPIITFSGSSGTIESEGYSEVGFSSYPSNLFQRYQINAPEGMAIALKFNEFYLDSGDSLRFREGKVRSFLLEGLQEVPFYEVTITSQLRLRFKTDSVRGPGQGFSVEYHFVNLTSQCETSDLMNIPEYEHLRNRSLDCRNEALNYASECSLSLPEISYRRDFRCVNNGNSSKFETVSMQLDDDLVERCEENPANCVYNFLDILDYYELTVPEGEFTPEEMEEFGDLDDDDDLNIGRGIGAGCGNFCRITIKNQKQKWIKPPNCKRVAKRRNRLQRCLDCRFGGGCTQGGHLET